MSSSSSSKKSIKREIQKAYEGRDKNSRPDSSSKRVEMEPKEVKKGIPLDEFTLKELGTESMKRIILGIFDTVDDSALKQYLDWKKLNKHWYNVIMSIEKGATNIWEQISKKWFPNVKHLPADLFVEMEYEVNKNARTLIESKEGRPPVYITAKDGAWFLHFRRTVQWINGFKMKFGDQLAVRKKINKRLNKTAIFRSYNVGNDLVMEKSIDSIAEKVLSGTKKLNIVDNAEFRRIMSKIRAKSIENITISVNVEGKKDPLFTGLMFNTELTNWVWKRFTNASGIYTEFLKLLELDDIGLVFLAKDADEWETYIKSIKEDFTGDNVNDMLIDDGIKRRLENMPKVLVKSKASFSINWSKISQEQCVLFESFLNREKSASYAKILFGGVSNGLNLISLSYYRDVKRFTRYLQELENRVEKIRNLYIQPVENFEYDPDESYESIQQRALQITEQKRMVMLLSQRSKINLFSTMFSHMKHFFNRLEDGYGMGFWETFVKNCFPKMTTIPEDISKSYSEDIHTKRDKKWCILAKRIWYWYEHTKVVNTSLPVQSMSRIPTAPLSSYNTDTEYAVVQKEYNLNDNINYDRLENSVKKVEDFLDIRKIESDNPVNLDYFIGGVYLFSFKSVVGGKLEKFKYDEMTLKIDPIIGKSHFKTSFVINFEDSSKWRAIRNTPPKEKFDLENAPSELMRFYTYGVFFKWGELTPQICTAIQFLIAGDDEQDSEDIEKRVVRRIRFSGDYLAVDRDYI